MDSKTSAVMDGTIRRTRNDESDETLLNKCCIHFIH